MCEDSGPSTSTDGHRLSGAPADHLEDWFSSFRQHQHQLEGVKHADFNLSVEDLMIWLLMSSR